MALLMVVDDNKDLCRVMSRTLRRLGHEVVTFNGGISALEFVREATEPLPDLIILDYMMPEKDGLSVLRDLRADPRGSAVPVAMFTANDDPYVEFQARVAGADDFWVKSRMDLPTMEQRIGCLLPIPRRASIQPLEQTAA